MYKHSAFKMSFKFNVIGLPGTGVAADTAAGRIMELSKKNRELTADLESERNKLRQMTKKMREMEREVQCQGAQSVDKFLFKLAQYLLKLLNQMCKLQNILL